MKREGIEKEKRYCHVENSNLILSVVRRPASATQLGWQAMRGYLYSNYEMIY